MTDLQKQQIVQHINAAISQYGSQNAVANKCEVSSALISQMVNDNWEHISSSKWAQVGAALNWKPSTGWNMVTTWDVRLMYSVFNDAKQYSMFLSISHPAGGGKSSGSELYARQHAHLQVYRIHCRDWSDRQFMTQLCTSLGIELPKGYANTDTILSKIIQFFLDRQTEKPLLVIDEADKLKPAALRLLIPLYNACEDRLGVVIMGTENLKKTIDLGVRYQKKGFDEIDSRFGRRHITLRGASESEVREICKANGITERQHQTLIWNECDPVEVQDHKKFIKVVKDLRRLKRSIQRDQINIKEAAAVA